MAPIVRGADTDRHSLAPEASGLWAISAGLAYNEPSDQRLLEKGMFIYDALYSWATHLQHISHTQQPFENLLLEVFNKFLNSQKAENKKVPEWAKELRDLIQDQIDTNLSLSLKGLSETLNVHPSYLSREFSKYFDNLTFGDYIRKLRIDKAIQLMATDHSLTEIAYLTGFSDQSHFTRIFRKHTGKSPSAYRKSLKK